MPKLKVSAFDSSKYLIDDEAVAAYLGAILEENDVGLLADALGQIAKARGMSQIAQASGMTREALYKALRADAHPRFETLSQVLMALGLKFTIGPIGVGAKVVAARTDKTRGAKTARSTRSKKSERDAA